MSLNTAIQNTTVSNIATNANYFVGIPIFQIKEYPSGIIMNLNREIDHFETHVIIGKDNDGNVVYVDIEYTDEDS